MTFNTQAIENLLVTIQEVKKTVVEGLNSNSYIVLESGPGFGRSHMINECLVQAHGRANALVMEVNLPRETDSVIFGTYGGVNNSFPTMEEQKNRVLGLMEKHNSDALVVDMEKGCDIHLYVEVAKSLNVPLVLSITTSENTVKTNVFNNTDELTAYLDNSNVTNKPKASVLDKIKELKSNTVEDSKAKKLTN